MTKDKCRLDIEKEAVRVNRTPKIDGFYDWMCFRCGKTWRTNNDQGEQSNSHGLWPKVWCQECN